MGFCNWLPDIGAEGFVGAGGPDDWGLMKPQFEDWRRVLTTSRGQVKIARIVPPVLEWQFYMRMLTYLECEKFPRSLIV